tara:strand:- start:6120 stop:10346 length:4227 start_codon:yes stop_codon:yes gene_type:complete
MGTNRLENMKLPDRMLKDSGGFKFSDPDTLISPDNKLLRIQGLEAAEISRILPDGTVTQGTAGGAMANEIIPRLASKKGFNNVVYLTNEDGSPMMDTTGTRQLVRLTDKHGKDFTATLAAEGLASTNTYSSDADIEAEAFGELRRSKSPYQTEMTDWEVGSHLMKHAAAVETGDYSDTLKNVALNEQELMRLYADRQPGESIQDFKNRRRVALTYSRDSVSIRSTDRDIMNNANNPLSTSWDVGVTGAMEGLYGIADMLGEKTGFDWIENYGEQNITRLRSKLEDMPQVKLSALKPKLDANGNTIGNEWDIDNVGEFFEFLGNNAMVSLPYMAATMGGAALAAPTYGASMLPIVAMYTGQTWNEMEGDNKSATLAVGAGITQAVLDRLGLKGITGTLMNKSVADKAVAAIVKRDGITPDAARRMLSQMTRREAALLTGSAATVAKEQLKARNVLRSLFQRGARGAVTEGTTEAMQEATAYMAAVAGSDKEFNAVELQNRLLNATIAGGTLGAGFSIPGAAIDVGAWTDIAVRQAEADPNKLSRAGSQYEADLEEFGRVESIQELTLEAGERVANERNKVVMPPNISNTYDYLIRPRYNKGDKFRDGSIAKADEPDNAYNKRLKQAKKLEDRFSTKVNTKTVDQRAADSKVDTKEMSTWDRVKRTWESIPGLWRGSTRFIFTDALQDSSRSLRKLADMFGANLQRTFSGVNFENRKKHLLTTYRNLVSTPAEFASIAGIKTVDQVKLSEIINDFGYWLVDPKGNNDKEGSNVNWNSLPANLKPYEILLKQYYNQQAMLSDKLLADQEKAYKENNKKFDVKRLNNYLMKYKSFNKGAIEKNRAKFIQTLMTTFKFNKADATTLTDNIINQDTLVSDQDFQVGGSKFIPAAHKKRTLGLSQRPEFNEFMERDAFVNISNAAKSASRVITYQEFLGDNNEKVAYLLNEAEKEGVSEQNVNRIAKQMQDYLNAESGNYKRIKNANISKIQKNLGVWTTIAGLPLATISSFVELAVTAVSVPPNIIFKEIRNASKEAAQAMWATMTDPRWNSTNRQLKKEQRQERIKQLGFFDWDVGAAQTTGATETTHASRRLLDKYFRVIGLQQWTDYTRNIRASIADDYIMSHLETIINGRKSGDAKTNDMQESEELLRNLGIDVELLIRMQTQQGPWNPKQLKDFDAMMLDAEFNFVNIAIALPNTANRPLYYQNQHLALFTQFQGFISTFTANQIPKMWGEYIKRGNPSLKYNAFAVMMTMIFLGFLSQYLKDLLKYGEPTPYLDPVEKIQRGVGASGLLGTGERVMNFMYPIYEQSSDSPAEWLFNTISGEAAALSNVSRVYGGAGKIIQGQPDKGAYDIMKTAPFIGPFNRLNRTIAEGLFGKSSPKEYETPYNKLSKEQQYLQDMRKTQAEIMGDS